MSSLLQTDKNCWRIENADRASFLIDGADYFAALREAMKNAQHAIYILGWDINSQLEMVRNNEDDGYPNQLGAFLNALAQQKQHLNVYILNWDFAMLYAPSREWLPIYQFDWKTHSRVQFCLDDHLPSGASHHQKMVIIDDALAFIGGLDLTMGRWDTSDHLHDNPRRDRIDDKIARPFHDVQVMLEGDVALALAELARERWQVATTKTLQPVDRKQPSELWPSAVSADMKNVAVGLARTRCAYEQLTEVREIQQFYLDAIQSAKHYIYIENQYFTVPSIAEAFQNSLKKEQGPEIVIVQPKATDGWMSQLTMDVLRTRLIKQLQQNDRYKRLKAFYPDGPGLSENPINVHAKIMIVDDTLVTVGSANLNNRSMGLDIECNIAIDATSDDALQQSIAGFHHRLLAEHLASTPEDVQKTLHETNSLIAGIEKLTQTDDRHLTVLPLDLEPEIDRMVPDADITDPKEPLEPEFFMSRILPEKSMKSIKSRIISWLVMIAGIAALVAIWKWTPLQGWAYIQSASSALAEFHKTPALPVWIIMGFMLAGFVRFPISLLVIPAVFLLGLLQGFIVSIVGGVLSAFTVYVIGKKLDRNTIRKLAGSQLNLISNKLAQRGIISIVAMRIVPAAPFTLINLVAGASHFHFRDYFVGTILGMAPGLFAVSVITSLALAAIDSPATENLIWLAFAVTVAMSAAYILMSWIAGKAGYRNKTSKKNEIRTIEED